MAYAYQVIPEITRDFLSGNRLKIICEPGDVSCHISTTDTDYRLTIQITLSYYRLPVNFDS